MAKSAVQRLDEQIAQELGLQLSPFVLTIKHGRKLHQVINGFVFAYTQDDTPMYDEVPVWRSSAGLRHKVTRYISHPRIEQRLIKRQYLRWYIRNDDILFPMQTSKVEDLRDNFYFVVDDNPLNRTQIVMTEDTQFIRKKPLLGMRQVTPAWGVPFPIIVVRKRDRMTAVT